MSIFGVYVVETYNVAAQYLVYKENSHILFGDMDEYLINNDINSRPTIPQSKRTGRSASPVLIGKFVTAHLLQTGKKYYIM